MSHTHFLYHVVFGTKDRLPLISAGWEDELFRYLGGIVKGHEGVPIAINGVADHVHLLLRLKPVEKFSDFMRELKAGSSKWVKDRHEPTFSWGKRYGAFTVSESVSGSVRRYIQMQKVHHGKLTFEEEYRKLLVLHNIDFEDRYLWT